MIENQTFRRLLKEFDPGELIKGSFQILKLDQTTGFEFVTERNRIPAYTQNLTFERRSSGGVRSPGSSNVAVASFRNR